MLLWIDLFYEFFHQLVLQGSTNSLKKKKFVFAYALSLKTLAKQPVIASLGFTSNSEYQEPLQLWPINMPK